MDSALPFAFAGMEIANASQSFTLVPTAGMQLGSHTATGRASGYLQ
jgi:hypothetical protein